VKEDYEESLLSGKPAHLSVYYLNDKQSSRDFFQQVSFVLNSYNQSVLGQRLWARGMDQKFLQPIYIDANDLSSSDPFFQIVASLIQFIVLTSIVMGAFYLAVDIVAGERERHSLEALLSLPISRVTLLVGKFSAIFSFCFLSGFLSIVNTFVWMHFIPASMYVSVDLPSISTAVYFLLLVLPLAFLFSATLLLLSVFSKTVKEAQTQFSAIMLLAMAPFVVLQFVDIDANSLVASLPVIGHYMISEQLLFEASYSFVESLGLSVSTLILAALVLCLAITMFNKEDILS
jgi:sodium transport system permease protein